MKPTTLNMRCLILGHNYYKDSSNNKVSCKHCSVDAKIDSNGDIIAESSENQMIENSLRQLFLLNRSLNSEY